MKGILYLIPSPIGENETYNCMPKINSVFISTCESFIVENIRTARRVLRKSAYKRSFDDITFYELNQHTHFQDIPSFLAPLKVGKNIGLLSEAGLPCVADPGWQVVSLCHKERIRVIPLVGACSIIMALEASGFCGQNFAFTGYLPIDNRQKISTMQKLEQIALKTGQTQIFIETPYRNNRLLTSLINNLHPDTMLCIATDLMLPTEQIISQKISNWRQIKVDLCKRNSVFLIGGVNAF
jgi:16S rRNA (cytidine1402-2'-O)-methyltransferase